MGRSFGQKNRHGQGVEACGMAQARRMVSRGPLVDSCTGWEWREKTVRRWELRGGPGPGRDGIGTTCTRFSLLRVHAVCSRAQCNSDSPRMLSHCCCKLRAPDAWASGVRSAPFLVSPLNCKFPSWQLGEQFDYLVKSVLGGEGGRKRQAVVASVTACELETGCLLWG